MSRTTGLPRLLFNGRVIKPDPVSLGDRRIDEGWLQDMINRHPDLLPIDDIGSAWGPLVSLGREIPTSVGSIDNLFVSPQGELTIVETKLWRNPEARRKVVGQVLDYASCLARMSYEELNDAVSAANAGDLSIWPHVQAIHGLAEDEEAGFHDVLSRNLAAGRFLLLIVGDGIREDVEGMADLLGGQPNAAFHLELVELRLYGIGDSDLLVVPSLVARTAEVERFTVRVVGDRAAIEESVQAPQDRSVSSTRARPLASVEAFIEAAAAEIGSDRAEAAARFIRWWEAQGGKIKRNSGSINLGYPFCHNTGGSVSVVTVYTSGEVQLSVAPFSKWRECIPFEEARALSNRHGFAGPNHEWPRREIDFADPSQWDQMVQLVEYVTPRIAAEEERLNREAD